ncbi:MAG: arginine--tRNA ligase [Candidatus Altiarchaeota archaeon]|nr:arginine--tRNA ligase [Candidatus Altiarchaeota archaeon]
MFIENLVDKTMKNLSQFSDKTEFAEFKNFGDFSTSLPLKIAKAKGERPDKLAISLAEQIKVKGLNAKPTGGFINFFLDDDALLFNLTNLTKFEKQNKTAVVEYSAPNIAKPFSVGHLRSTVIGESIRRIFDFLGWKTIGLNFIGDWGTQFGKLLVAYEMWPTDISKDPIKELLSLYVKFHEEAEKNPKLNDEAKIMFKKLEEGDKKIRKTWEIFRNLSLKEFEKMYAVLKTSKLEDYSESKFFNKGQKIADELLKEGIAEMSEGAVIIPVPNKPPLILRKSDGTTIYSTRDLVAGIERFKAYKPEVMVYVVGNEQKLHFEQLLYVLKKLKVSAKMEHVGFGMMRLPEGKMSTRRGRVVFLEDVLAEAMNKVKVIMKERGVDNKSDVEKIGIGAVKFADLKTNRNRDVLFDWKMLKFDGETGPYVQYAAVRAKRIGEKFGKGKIKILPENTKLARKIVALRLAVINAKKNLRPDILANYLMELSQLFNEFYTKEKISGNESHEWITSKVYEALENGLFLLGIEVPNQM